MDAYSVSRMNSMAGEEGVRIVGDGVRGGNPVDEYGERCEGDWGGRSWSAYWGEGGGRA